MSFFILTDTSANLPAEQLAPHHVGVVPLPYYVEEVEHACLDIDAFDGDVLGVYENMPPESTCE